MSKFIEEERSCAHCGQPLLCKVAVSLNVNRTSLHRENILNETFHIFTCGQCGKKTMLDEPFIYTDFDRKHWIGVFPLAFEKNWTLYENQAQHAFDMNMTGKHTSAMARKMADGFRVRTVFGLRALKEKLLCFEGNVDDAELALMKLELMKNMQGFHFHPNGRPMLVDSTENILKLEAQTISADNKLLHEIIEIPRSMLNENAHAPENNALLEKMKEGPYIDCGRILFSGVPE